MPEQLMFNAFVMGAPTHNSAGLWRHPDAQQLRYADLDHWVTIAKKLEEGHFDAIFFADVLGLFGRYNDSYDVYVKEGLKFPIDDSLALVAALIGSTENLGLAFTSSIIQELPYTFARRVSTLDHLSKGRIAWNIVTSGIETAHLNMGLEGFTDHDERYRWAEEYLDVLFKLWEGSWEDDAVVADVETGIYARPEKIHRIDHVGERYKVQGPHMTEPSPQRTPFLFQAGSSGTGRRFAARYAEGQFVVADDPAGATRIISSVRDLAVEEGRRPNDIKFFQGLLFVIGSTDREAQARYEEIQSYRNYEAVAAEAGGNLGVDFGKLGLDDVVDFENAQGGLGPLQALAAQSKTGKVTVRDYLHSRAESHTIIGSPETIADELEKWRDAGIDGVNMMNRMLPKDYVDFVDHVVPVLQTRNLIKKEYAPGSLREKLTGAPRLNDRHPATRYRGAFVDPL